MPRTKHKRPPPKTRRARGTGAFFWSNTLKLYIGRVKVGAKVVERRAPTVGALNAKLAAIAPPGPTTTVAEWAERWFASHGGRGSTKSDYRRTLDQFVLPTLGHLRVADLTAHDIEAASRRWATEFGTLTANTLRKNMGQFQACLEDARRARLITENPARDAKRPRAKKIKIDPFTPEELLAIVLAPDSGVYALLASTGCRLGEALALDVADLDVDTGWVSISKTYTRKHGTRPPKSENGVRTVRLPRQALAAVGACVGGRKSGPLFMSRTGKRREHSVVRSTFRVLLKRLGIRYRYPHQMRHGVATMWVSRGVPIGDVAKRLGDSILTVIRTYVHPSGADPTDATEAAWGGR